MLPLPAFCSHRGKARPSSQLGLLAVGVVLCGFNLRLSIASVPPLLTDLERHPGLSPIAADVLTAVPFVCFALGALAGSRLLRCCAVESALAVVLASTALGSLVRAAGTTASLLIGTAIAAAAIAVGNVVLPVLIKARFPRRTGLLIGLYTSALSIGAGLAGGVTVPLSDWLGWQGALAAWAIPAIVPLAILTAGRRESRVPTYQAGTRMRTLLADPLAWHVALFFGLQAAIVFSGLSWLPSILRSDGYSTTIAGALLALYTIGGVPASLAVPVLAARISNQRVLAVGCAVLEATALGGLALFPSMAAASVVLFALGQGASFSLAVSLITLRSGDASMSAQLGSMTQAVGYAVAAAGPFAVGILHWVAHTWTPPLLLLIALCFPMAVTGARAGRAGYVTGRPDDARAGGVRCEPQKGKIW